MKKLVEAVIENLSTREVFLFRVICGSCGTEYGNKPIRFSKAETPPTTQSKQIIYNALYEQEYRDARRIAIRNAAEHMNYCPICKQLICDQSGRECRYHQLPGCYLFQYRCAESDRELKYENSNGEEVSFNPPRYEYSYDFNAQIRVNHPYFDEITFQLNRDSIDLETVARRPGAVGIRTGFDPMLYPAYRQYRKECDELEDLFRAGMQGIALKGFAPAVQPIIQAAPVPQPTPEPAPASTGPKFCPNCGAPADGGKFCQSCGSRL